MPFPNINAGLAVKAHMYICERKRGNDYCLIKCQSFKNKDYNLKHFVIEKPDISRNPFKHPSLIDCEKRFNLREVLISDQVLTKRRRDISSELFKSIEDQITEECVDEIVDIQNLIILNRGIKLIK